ncbi:MAG TPA: PAS domain-containing protein [Gemmatimonadales bacterium]|nr:PAS domain-containing protein [Gemmatimonadales bacterium]
MTTLDQPRCPAEPFGSRLEFETLLSNTSAALLAALSDQLEPVIEQTLDSVRQFFRADRCALLSVSPDQQAVHVLLGAYAEGIPPVPRDLNLVPAFPWSSRRLLVERGPVRIETLADLPPEAAAEREMWLQMPIRSALSLPIASQGVITHLIVLNTVHRENRWPDDFVPRLQVLGELLAAALMRQKMFTGMQEAEERLDSGAELAGLAFYVVNFLTQTTFVDDRFREVCGVPAECESGLGVLAFWMEQLHPDDRPRVLQMRDQLHDGQVERVALEYRFLHPVKGERWIHHSARVAERDADRRAIRTFGVLRDITDRKLADAELGQLGRRLIAAHEAERALLARELHDDVTQRLAVLAIDVGRAEAAAPHPADATAMREIRHGLIRLSEDVHALAYQLHPSVLEELGLAEALRAECERVGRRDPLALTVDIDPVSTDLNREAALCLFRVAQEALSNVSHHARARSASVTLRPMSGGWLLAVRDDGVGFALDQRTPARTLGLTSMRERVRLVNGSLDIESAPGQGTTVVAWVPGTEGTP